MMKDDLDKYISRRKCADKKFAESFEGGYQEFKAGVLLRQARQPVPGAANSPRRVAVEREGAAARTKFDVRQARVIFLP
jgi:hypothetical protein